MIGGYFRLSSIPSPQTFYITQQLRVLLHVNTALLLNLQLSILYKTHLCAHRGELSSNNSHLWIRLDLLSRLRVPLAVCERDDGLSQTLSLAQVHNPHKGVHVSFLAVLKLVPLQGTLSLKLGTV